ncbi:rhodanese-like domain-containing protein [Arsenicicoccus sp. oral taxon 190]|uniref:rhodanese-like domain-containing protein n=1 Tax=Arsenicicoccus sp. oral taxon 190 TaxID=1658671 RepID=UPI0012E13CEA|nr:rhodanese-like domain-containing protein [Arsenicicoccus sp. oral taxon 190]
MTDRPRGIEAHLTAARRGLTRLTPREAYAAQQAGAVLVDTRTPEQRAETGEVPGAVVIDRTVLEWRLDPTFAWRIPEASSWDTTYVVLCRQGYSSSLAARSLQDLGLRNATDVIGGVEAWVADGLPLTRAAADVRR